MAGRATPLATPIDLGDQRNVSDRDLADRLHPSYADPIRRAPAGDAVFRGLPFELGAGDGPRRWLLVDRPTSIDLAGSEAASRLVIAHFCDAWRDPERGRPPDLPVGWVTPAGQPLARYTLELASGGQVATTIRRRFEVNEGIVGWGQGAFAAVPHGANEAIEWRGPLPSLAPARYAAAGEAGLLAILPGSWGPAQTGVADSVPSPTGDITFWLFELEVPSGDRALALLLEPLGSIESGGGVVVAGLTLFRGTASPTRLAPRRTIRVHGDAAVDVDLGQVFRTRAAPGNADDHGAWRHDSVPGWGSDRSDAQPAATARDIDLAFAPDASLRIGREGVAAARLPEEGPVRVGSLSIEALPTPSRRVEVEVVDAATGAPVPARVHFHAADGRYLPPLGHRDEINPGLNEDTGADVMLGDTSYAYVPGRFPIELPAGRVYVEAARGFGYRPVRQELDVDRLDRPLVLRLEPLESGGGADWAGVDSHVHFISPTSALLQAAAEGIAIVNLLATQWGDHHTSVTDLPAAIVADSSGEHLVVMGSENRQNMLGHIGLLGTPSAVLPMASAGPPEARLGEPLEWLIADWADAVHAQRGLAVAVHFPLPYAEVAADIVSGRVDAVEMQALTLDVDGPSIREWYRFLNLGYRLPVVGGTDKMSAEVPVGAIRTYARLDPDLPLSFGGFAAAVRAGRTFVSSGSFVSLAVDGCEAGEVVRLGRDGGVVEVRASASAALPLLDRLELIHDGRVIASTTAPTADRLALAERVRVTTSGWLAARVTSRGQMHSAFTTGMGAHSSPVYLEVAERPPFSAADAAAIGTIIDGARTWVEQIATVRSEAERERMADYFSVARERLDALSRERS